MCQCECDDLREEIKELKQQIENLSKFILDNTSEEEIKLGLLG